MIRNTDTKSIANNPEKRQPANDELLKFEEWTRKRVPVMKKYLEKLEKTAQQILDQIGADNEDHVGVMCICFLSKQLEHARAVILLGSHRDTELVGRSMLEGLAQLIWGTNGGPARTRLWRDFGHIHNLRQIRRNHEIFGDENPEYQAKVEKCVKALGDQFFSDQARKLQAARKPLPKDPYTVDWTGMSVKMLFAQVESSHNLYRMYSRGAEWHHWGFSGLSRALDTRGKIIKYQSESSITAAPIGGTRLRPWDFLKSWFSIEIKINRRIEGFASWNKQYPFLQ